MLELHHRLAEWQVLPACTSPITGKSTLTTGRDGTCPGGGPGAPPSSTCHRTVAGLTSVTTLFLHLPPRWSPGSHRPPAANRPSRVLHARTLSCRRCRGSGPRRRLVTARLLPGSWPRWPGEKADRQRCDGVKGVVHNFCFKGGLLHYQNCLKNVCQICCKNWDLILVAS